MVGSLKRLFATALAGILLSFSAFAGRTTWPMDPYSYYANNSSVRQVCEDFASGFGLIAHISPKVHGILSGRLSTSNPTSFLNSLSSMYGLTWFVNSGVLYVNLAEELSSRSIRVSSGTAPQIYKALMSLGVVDPRFGWGILPEQNIVMVSGPPPYLDLIERTIKELPIVAGGMQVAVFHVKNASVIDRTIYYRNNKITSPGLATLLQQLLSNAQGEKVALAQSSEVRKDVQELRASIYGSENKSDSSTKGGKGAAANSKPEMARPKSYNGPSIQPDPRTNSIVVSDLPERISMYKKLIDELDIPISLIQVQVTIIDLNTTHDRELGINWSAGYDNGAVSNGLTSGGISDKDIGIAVGPSGASVNPTTLVVQSARYFLAKVRMLEGRGDATVQSRPSILTTENTGAVLDYSDTFYIQTTGERVASVTPETVGTSLRVTPHLISSGSQTGIKLTIDIQNGSILDKKIGSYPVIRNSTVSTEAIVHENESLLIGGFYYDFSETGSEGIPFLNHIPVIGHLFAHSHHNIQRRERIFLIQPTVLDPDRVLGNEGVKSNNEVVPSEDVMLPEKLKNKVMSSSTDSSGNVNDKNTEDNADSDVMHVDKKDTKENNHKANHFYFLHRSKENNPKVVMRFRQQPPIEKSSSSRYMFKSNRRNHRHNMVSPTAISHKEETSNPSYNPDKSYDNVLSFLRAREESVGNDKSPCSGCDKVSPPRPSDEDALVMDASKYHNDSSRPKSKMVVVRASSDGTNTSADNLPEENAVTTDRDKVFSKPVLNL